jgi:hypothetical protein
MTRNGVATYLEQANLSEKLVSVGMTLHRLHSIDQATRQWRRVTEDLGWVADRLAAIRKSGADVPPDLDQAIGWFEDELEGRLWDAPGGDVLRDQARAILDEIRAATTAVDASPASTGRPRRQSPRQGGARGVGVSGGGQA